MSKIWYVGNPRLWWKYDLVNHPELVALDGQEIPDSEATDLLKVYPDGELLTKPLDKCTPLGFENADVILKVPVSNGMYLACNLFDEEITSENFDKITEQWLTGDTSLDKSIDIDITFKHNEYIVSEYWMIAASGVADNAFTLSPTPNTWALKCLVDDEWCTLDERADVENWEAFKIKDYRVANPRVCKHLRLTIIKWNPGEIYKDDFYTGLKRLWIFGRKKHKFTLPKLQSPDENFVWVVPYNDLTLED